MIRIRIWTDGGVSPNPGKGKIRFVVEDIIADKTYKLHDHEEEFAGTNNEAELRALHKGMAWALVNVDSFPGVDVEILTDSQNAICWIDGTFARKAENLKGYLDTIDRHLLVLKQRYKSVRLIKTTHAENKAHPDLSTPVAMEEPSATTSTVEDAYSATCGEQINIADKIFECQMRSGHEGNHKTYMEIQWG
jgi:ribonuclease HI